MPKTPRPTDPKLLKGWALSEFPNDPVRQKRAVDAGMQAISQAQASAARNQAEMARRQNNRLGKKR